MTEARAKVRTGPGLTEPVYDDWGIRTAFVKTDPFNYGLTSDVVRETEKAIQVDYYSWRLWLPKRCVRRVDGRLFSFIDAINRAKDHDSAERIA